MTGQEGWPLAGSCPRISVNENGIVGLPGKKPVAIVAAFFAVQPLSAPMVSSHPVKTNPPVLIPFFA